MLSPSQLCGLRSPTRCCIIWIRRCVFSRSVPTLTSSGSLRSILQQCSNLKCLVGVTPFSCRSAAHPESRPRNLLLNVARPCPLPLQTPFTGWRSSTTCTHLSRVAEPASWTCCRAMLLDPFPERCRCLIGPSAGILANLQLGHTTLDLFVLSKLRSSWHRAAVRGWRRNLLWLEGF